ncbi:MAG: SulP family inorganic anion transporter, partial [Pseudomonadota bacterium]
MSATGQQGGYGLPDQAPTPRPQPAARQTAARAGWLQHVRGDLVGGFTAAMLTIPISMGYGLLALSALGDAYVPHAILAGLYAPVIGCIVAVLLGANTTMVYSPRSIVTFLIGSIVLHSFARSSAPFLQAADGSVLLVLSFLLVFLAGLFQALFGAFRLGTLVKYIPAPVFVGFQNAAAILIFFSQVDTLLGFRQHVPVFSIPSEFAQIQPLTLIVGLVTIALIMKGARLIPVVPPSILGLIGGIAVYYLFALLGFSGQLGPVVGSIPFAWPNPHYLMEFGTLMMNPQFVEIMPMLLTSALSLAIVASLDAVLCARLIESDSGNRVQSNGELVRLGAGNMVAACFGGIANGINLGSSFANHRAGARTPLSLLTLAAVILLAILALAPQVAILPRVVMAAMLTVVAIQLVDRWTLQLISKLLKLEFSNIQSMLLDLLVILVVTV